MAARSSAHSLYGDPEGQFPHVIGIGSAPPLAAERTQVDHPELRICTNGLLTEEEMQAILQVMDSDIQHVLAIDGRQPDASLSSAPDGPRTSLMIRNVPVRYSIEELLVEWCEQGNINFLYLPWNDETQRNRSHAFLNFVSDAKALKFVQQWEKQRSSRYSAKKPLNIRFADVQGLKDNLLVLKRSHRNIETCKVAVFENGRRIRFEDALQRLRSTARRSTPPRVAAAPAMLFSL